MRFSLRLAVSALTAAGLGCSARVERTAVETGGIPPLLVSVPDVTYDGAIRVASIYPTVGRYAQSGIQCENGTRMAIEDVNRHGGIHGRRLKLLAYRTGSYFVDARQAAEMAVADGQVMAIIGSNASSLSALIAEVAGTHHVVQVSNNSTAEDLTWDPNTRQERPYVFRVCGSDAAIGELLARFARDHLAARRVAVLYEVGRTYSLRMADNFVKHFQAPQAGRVTERFFYLQREIDFRGQLRSIAAFRPDVIFLPGDPTDATLVAVQADALGLRATLLGADAWSSRGLFSHGGPVRDAYYADLCSPPEDFRERYRSLFGDECDGCRAVLAYDAVQILSRALAALGPLQDSDLLLNLGQTRKRLREVLARTTIEGRTGRIRFDIHRDRRGGLAIMRVQPRAGGGYRTRLDLGPTEG